MLPAVEVCDCENPIVKKLNASETGDCMYLSGSYLSLKLIKF